MGGSRRDKSESTTTVWPEDSPFRLLHHRLQSLHLSSKVLALEATMLSGASVEVAAEAGEIRILEDEGRFQIEVANNEVEETTEQDRLQDPMSIQTS